jgi:SEC-C motif-containing protein
MNCACGSQLSFEKCCEPFITGKTQPETAEALMRSRYTAYTLGKVEYIQKTLASESQSSFDLDGARQWAASAEWLSLKILSVKKGLATDSKGTVEFTATFKEDGKTLEHHEVSEFRKNKQGNWVFVDGDAHTHEEGHSHHDHHSAQTPVIRDTPKVGRNDPCPCGSEKKYKKCCGLTA